MSNSSQFRPGGLPVGTIVEAPYNLSLTDSSWIPCNGQRLVRATYPLLASQFPSVGVFDGTQRTKTAAAAAGGCASNGTIWVAASATGTTAIQTTPDGVTWTSRTTPSASNIPSSIIYTGTRFIFANAGAVAACHSTDGITWATGTGAPAVTNTSLQCLAYAPSASRVGHVTSNANFYISNDHGQNWTTTAHGIASFTPSSVVWTGNTFFSVQNNTQNAMTTANGTTGFGAVRLPFIVFNSSQCGLQSDGNGRVTCFGIGSANIGLGLWLSKDHGQTWSQVVFPLQVGQTILGTGAGHISYTNSRWFASTSYGLVISSDGENWVYVPDIRLLDSVPASFSATVCFRSSGTYMVGGGGATTTATTIVEDTTKFYAPPPVWNANASNQTFFVTRQHWIKAS